VVLTVRPGQIARPLEIGLQPAPALRGLVITTDGLPINGATVVARPRGNGYQASAAAGVNGRFVLHFDQPGPHELSFVAPGCESATARYEPGDPEITIALSAAPTVLFEVCEAGTRLPISAFGVRVMAADPASHWLRQSVRSDPQSTRELRLPVRSDRDLWQADAPGYAPPEGALDPGVDRQVLVVVTPGSRVRGEITADGDPVSHAVVRLALDVTRDDPPYAPDSDWIWIHPDESDLSQFVGRMRQVTAASNGRFEFVDLAADTYRVSGTAEDGRFVGLRQVRVPVVADLELGRLSVSAGARIRGLVTVDGEPASNIDVVLGRPYADGCANTFTVWNGIYEFEGVRPARYQVQFLGAGRRRRVVCRVAGEECLRVDGDL